MINNETYFKNQLSESVQFGFVSQNDFKLGTYAPELILNKPEAGQYVLTEIQYQLEKCQSFCLSVSFVTLGGISMIKSQLSDILEKGTPGKIIISPYLGFNDPNAMRELLKFKNIEVRITKDSKNMHAKCYLFNYGLEQIAIIGSSNLTETAMKVNYEWNIKLTSSKQGKFIEQTQIEFNDLWENSDLLTEDLIDAYERTRKVTIFKKSESLITEKINEISTKRIIPNAMQDQALMGLKKLREKGSKRALVISATGTGKTFLSAFDVQNFEPKKFLFIVHREQILRKAMQDYKKVIGFSDDEAKIYRSGEDISEAKYLFATIQTISKDHNLRSFEKNIFDYILIDEVHKAGATTYKKVIDYFEPKFLLGMTATPERTDGFNIYELFDYNIAYEIRLQDALNEEMLCPFMYFGVKDLIIDGKYINEKTTFNHLVSDKRVDHIINKIDFYTNIGSPSRGLIFCSSKKEAHELSEKLNRRGKKTVALTGDDSQERRQFVVHQLENGEVEYILTVDVFNEGIDIPSINQVIMLRNTKSSIIFIQQLGRGLRKHESKDYVVVIDFIGNYSNNYLIPSALYGDSSLNKDNVRRKIVNRNQINGITTVNFEEIAREKIFESINSTTLSSIKLLREKYLEMRQRLGRVPMLEDFVISNHLDPLVLFESSFKNYSEVINKFEEDKTKHISLNEYESKFLNYLCKELLNGKRIHEVVLLSLILNKHRLSKSEVFKHFHELGINIDKKILDSIINHLTLNFFQPATRTKYEPIVREVDDFLIINEKLVDSLKDSKYMGYIKDVIKTAGIINQKYNNTNPLTIGEKYSRKDVCRLLNWENDESSTIYGYKVKYQTCPIFVTYHKSEGISESTQYQDSFINDQLFHWYTRSRRYLHTKEVSDIINSRELGIDLHLFVKKEDGEGSDFYYLGQVNYQKNSAIETKMPNSGEPVVTMNLILERKVQYSLLHYLTH